MIDVVAIARASLKQAGLDFDQLSVIEMSRSPGREPAFALLAFLDEQATPTAIIKATAAPGRAAGLRDEFANLEALRRNGKEHLASSVPAPLFLGKIDGLAVLAESVLPGTRMKNLSPQSYFSSRRFTRDFKAVVRWLDSFRRCFGDVRLAPTVHGLDGAAGAIERYRNRFRVSATLDALLDETAERLASYTAPNPPWHGDFCTANLLLSDEGEVGVIDWEYPLATCWPLADLLYFISSIRAESRTGGKAERVAAYRHLLFEPHRHSELFRESVDWYLTEAGLVVELILPLSVITWVVYANRTMDVIDRLRSDDPDYDVTDYMPLVLLDDDHCLNLELLAERRATYTLAPGQTG